MAAPAVVVVRLFFACAGGACRLGQKVVFAFQFLAVGAIAVTAPARPERGLKLRTAVGRLARADAR